LYVRSNSPGRIVGTSGAWDGYEINDSRRSIVRAPNPDEFRGLSSEQRIKVAKASRENLAVIVRDHTLAGLVPKLVEALAALLNREPDARESATVLIKEVRKKTTTHLPAR
jgi:hypothetical protein